MTTRKRKGNTFYVRREEKKIKIPLFIFLGLCFGILLLSFGVLLMFVPKNNDIPDYMTSEMKVKQVDIPEETQTQTEPLPQPTTLAEAYISVFTQIISNFWLLFIFSLPFIIITSKFIMRVMR